MNPPEPKETKKCDCPKCVRNRYVRQMRSVGRMTTTRVSQANVDEKMTKKMEHFEKHRMQIAKLQALLQQNKLKIQENEGNGNCLFYSIAAYMPPEMDHIKIREMICDYIEANQDLFKVDIECDAVSVEEYLREMRKVGTWGDAIMANAFCIMFNVNIVLFTPDGISELYPGEDRPKMGMVLLGSHYCCTAPIDS